MEKKYSLGFPALILGVFILLSTLIYVNSDSQKKDRMRYYKDGNYIYIFDTKTYEVEAITLHRARLEASKN